MHPEPRNPSSSTICGSLFWPGHFQPPGAPHAALQGVQAPYPNTAEEGRVRATPIRQSLAFHANLDWPSLGFHLIGGPTDGMGCKLQLYLNSINLLKSKLKMQLSKNTKAKDEWAGAHHKPGRAPSFLESANAHM